MAHVLDLGPMSDAQTLRDMIDKLVLRGKI
jgi:hypothetical protein